MEQLTFFYIPKNNNIKKTHLPVVLSASRMTDMPKYYPRELIFEVDKRVQKGTDIHTLVLWTKHPYSLLLNPLYNYLISLKKNNIQLYIQLTITGLGKIPIGEKQCGKSWIIEPNSSSYADALSILPDLIDLSGKPSRIRLRIDPIIKVKDCNGKVFSNLKYLPKIVNYSSNLDVRNFSFSLLEKNVHKKVNKRFSDIGCEIISLTQSERASLSKWLHKIESNYNVNIQSCCVPGFKNSSCIDGELLQKLHDCNRLTNLSLPKKREKCNCTYSIDIGGWPPKKCYTGCDYCYANSIYKNK